MKKTMKNIMILFSAFMLGGCASATYVEQGVELKKKETFAKVITQTQKNHTLLTSGYDRRVYITSLDGKDLFKFFGAQDFPDEVYLKPGKRYLDVQYLHRNSYANGCLWLDAKKSQNYIIKRRIRQEAVFFWIENVSTKEKVGGVCESDPNYKSN